MPSFPDPVYLFLVLALDGKDVVDGRHLQLFRLELGHVEGQLELVLVVLDLHHLKKDEL